MTESAGSSRAALCFAFAAKDFALIYGTAFYFVYLFSVLEFDPHLPVWLWILGLTAAGCCEVIAGFLYDHLISRHALFRSCLLAGTSVFLVLMFILPSQVDNNLACVPVFFGFLFCYGSAMGCFMGDIAEFASKMHLRESLLSFPQGIGFAISTVLCGLYIYILNFVSDGSDYVYIYTSGSVIAALFILIFHENLQLTSKSRSGRINSIRQALALLFSNDQLLTTGTAAFLREFAVVLQILALAVYALYFNSLVWMLSLFILAPAVTRPISGIMYSGACDIFPRRSIYMIATVMAFCGTLCAALLDIASDTLTAGVVMALALGSFGSGWMLSTIWTMGADCADYGEFKLVRRSPALCFSFIGGCRCAGCAAAAVVNIFATSLASHYYRPLGSEVALYAFRAQIVLSALCVISCAFIYNAHYKLNGSVIENIISGLERTHLGLPKTVKLLSHPLRYALCRKSVICHLDSPSVDEVIDALCGRLGLIHAVSDPAAFRNMVRQKMQFTPAGVAEGIAIPHASGKFVTRPAIAVATLVSPLDFSAPDGRKCDLIFLLAAPDDGQSYITLLGQLALMLSADGFADRLRNSMTASEITDRILECEKHIPL